MKNNTIQKINTFGKAGYILCKISRIILSIAIIACLVGAIVMCFAPKEPILSGTGADQLQWILLACAVGCLLLLVPFYFAEKLCKTFQNCETPFTEDVSGLLMKLAYSIIGIAIIGMLGESITASFLNGQFMLHIEFDLVTVLLILCIFMLSYIFKHGTELQIQSDETL